MDSDSTASTATIDADEFISTMSQPLNCGKLEEALASVKQRWHCSQIVALLGHASNDVRKMAALALSLVGDKTAVKPLAIALHDSDAMVTQMAEHALWSLWLRLGSGRAVCLVKAGNIHLHHGNFVCAAEKFSQAIQTDPTFAEAYNQRAIAYYLTERYAESIADCRKALELMPQHFGAMAEMGHCHSHLEEWVEARKCYRMALAIHPRMEGIEGALAQVEKYLAGKAV